MRQECVIPIRGYDSSEIEINVLNEVLLNVTIPIENVRPFPANSLRKSATNFSLMPSFCLKKQTKPNISYVLCQFTNKKITPNPTPNPNVWVPGLEGYRYISLALTAC